MITQRIDQLIYDDIERFVEQKVPESRVLDYKRQLPNGTIVLSHICLPARSTQRFV